MAAGRRTHTHRTRRRIIGTLLILALPVLLFLLVARSPLTALIVTPVLDGLTGATVHVQSATISLRGRAVLRGVTATAPAVDGPAATFVDVGRIDTTFSWRDLIRGRGVRTITLLNPKLRLSQSTDTQLLNVSGLTLLRPSATSATALPTIVIDDAALEIGEHTGSDYAALSVLHFDASIIPDPASPTSASTIRITTLAPEGPILGLPGQDITGRIDNDGVTITPAELSLTSLRPSTLPASARRELELLDLRGRLRLRSFNYTFASGRVEAEVILSGVAMNLPVEATTPEGASGPLRMTRVNGVVGLRSDRIRADLRGLVADMPYTVDLDYMGSTRDAPFTCEIATDGFHVSSRPDILPFAPDVVREHMASFSNPTATVSSRVTLTRDPPTPDGPSPVRVRGTLDFRDGTASFRDFPYIFRQMTGLVSFDDEKIVLQNIDGVSDTGARLSATGTIAPPNELAVVDIVVRVSGVPVDDNVARAMGPERQEIISALFSQARHRELIAGGLILGEPEAARLRDDLDRLRAMPIRSSGAEARLAAVEEALARIPVFTPGGNADVVIHVTRPYGHLTPWTTDVIVTFASLGVLPEAFPLPIIATDVRLHITDKTAVLDKGTYRTPRGGLATVECTVDLYAPDGSQDFIPHITINAGAIPVDDLLIHSIPDRPADAATASASSMSAREALTALDLDGAVDIRASIEPIEDGTLGYAVSADVNGLRAAPSATPGGPSLLLSDLKGSIHVTDRGFEAELRSPLRTLPAHAEADAISVPAGDATVTLSVPFKGSTGTTARAVIQGLDLAAPIEDVIRPVAPEAAEGLAALRERHAPAGHLDAEVDVTADASDVRGRVVLQSIQSAAFGALNGRASLSVVEGRVIAEAGRAAGSTSHVRFEDFAAAIDYAGAPMGRIALSGDLRVASERVIPGGTDLRLNWTDAPLDSDAIRSLLRQSLGEAAEKVYVEHNPIGHFDVDLRLAESPGPDGSTLGAWGSLKPRRLSFARYGQRIDFPSVNGSIDFWPGGGRFDHLALNADGMSLSLDGVWTDTAAEQPDIDLTIDGWANSPGTAINVLLPGILHDMAEGAQLTIDGSVRLNALKLAITGDPRADGASIRASGSVTLDNASMTLGLPITNLSGAISFLAAAEPGSTTFDVGLISPSLNLAKLHITDARVRVASDPNDPRVFAPLISGATHGGRFSGRAIITLDPHDPARREYFASLHVAGARFASVLADLTQKPAPDTGTPPPPATVTPDPSRGMLDAEVTLSGTVGDAGSTVGRGEFAVSGGEVLSLPLLLPILQVTNLQVPTAEPLDLALASFHLSDGQVVFEEMSVFSRSVELFGYGRMSWPGTDLDLRVVSRAARPFPIVSSIIEAVRNELISVRVEGTLTSPDVDLAQFSSTRGLMRRLLSAGQDEQAREMEQIRLRATAAQDRVRRAGERIKDIAKAPAIQGE